jgi:glycosyltransferase involved in cell wall biosynthesis
VKVALVSPHVVGEGRSGDRARTGALRQSLRDFGVDASVIALNWPHLSAGVADDFLIEPLPAQPLARWVVRATRAGLTPMFPYALFNGYWPAQLRRLIARENFEVVDFQHSFLWRPVRQPTVLTVHNVLSNSKLAPRTPLLGLTVRLQEGRAIRGADRVVAFSQAESDRLKAKYGCRAATIPIGYPSDASAVPRLRPRPSVAGITGSFDYEPNRQAAVWLHNHATQLATMGLTDLRFIGRAADTLPFRAGPGVRILSDVPDLRAELRKLDLVLVPLVNGGGVRVKILEAFATGVPVVATALAAEGIGDRGSRYLEVSDDLGDFLTAVARALPWERRHAMTTTALELWRNLYSPERMAEAMTKVYEQALGGDGSSA